ncbi:MAG: septal ring lytic transglycosylase RlpA family protein [Myxococcales bacterium]|nr:MAG: septal ring lytic transglycosylase RlpA family protein [Myxococcales bacterium]
MKNPRKTSLARCSILSFVLLASSCCYPQTRTPSDEDNPWRTEGRASYYHDSLHGNTTANGDIYDKNKLTAASRTLPFGTLVRVTRKDNGRSVVVRINDRGPFADPERRIIDLSRAAAEELDMIRAGVVDVRLEFLKVP